jgi:hypothetical protein
VGTDAGISAAQRMFQVAIWGFFATVVLDIFVAWALYLFLRPVNSGLAFFSALARTVYAVLLAWMVLFLVEASHQAGTGNPEAAALSLDGFFTGWNKSLAVFSLHLLAIGILAILATSIPNVIGFLLLLAGAGYLIDGVGHIISPSYSLNLALYTFVGEIVLMIWLLWKGRRL